MGSNLRRRCCTDRRGSGAGCCSLHRVDVSAERLPLGRVATGEWPLGVGVTPMTRGRSPLLLVAAVAGSDCRAAGPLPRWWRLPFAV
jgi:hypothetical protein